MTVTEMEKVVNITNIVDGDCHVCAGDLARKLIGAFPEHKTLVKRLYENHHKPSKLDE